MPVYDCGQRDCLPCIRAFRQRPAHDPGAKEDAVTDPVNVLAADLCCLGPCEAPNDCTRDVWIKPARARIRALERTGFKVIERPLPKVADPKDPFIESYGAISAFWDVAPTYGDKT